MFFDFDLRGDALPPRTLCLTFDDGPGRTEGPGPGPKTAELGDYLAGQGIAATFFVVGSHVRANPGIVARLRAGGHLVGNHTDTHPPLVAFVRDRGDVHGEIARADEAIGAPAASGELVFFRPPYGDWRDEPVPTEWGVPPVFSAVARTLDAAGRYPHLVGPVGWDISAADWNFWKEGRSAEECGQANLEAIEVQGRGIVLMHDSAETEAMRNNNLTLEMVRWLVPLLQERGYQFVRLDEVPGIRTAVQVTRQVWLGTGLWQWLTCPADSTRIKLTTSHKLPGGRERFGVVPVGQAKRGELVGLRAWNGRYLTRTKKGPIVAEALTIDDASRWQLASGPDGRVEIRSSRHESLAIDDHPREVRLRANVRHPIRFEVESRTEPDPDLVKLLEKEG